MTTKEEQDYQEYCYEMDTEMTFHLFRIFRED